MLTVTLNNQNERKTFEEAPELELIISEGCWASEWFVLCY
jgi:hypothetical protein